RAGGWRWAVRGSVRLGLLLLGVAVVGAVRWRERTRTRAFVAARLAEADAPGQEVQRLDEQVDRARAAAFARFDADDWPGGETRWKEALELARREARAFAAASGPLARALAR